MLKSQIDTLIKSNKIVIIVNDNGNNTKKRAAMSSSKSLKSASFKIEPLKCQSYEGGDFNTDMIHLFELYGIDLSKVSILRLNDFPNPNECELYLKEKHLENNKTIKYPMVFIHGIYLGSDEEIDLAHSEGFLFDLFKDTGLYPTTATVKNLSAVSDRSDEYEQAATVSSASGDYESETTTSNSSRAAENNDDDDDEDDDDYPQFDFDLWTVAKANRYSAAVTSSRPTRIFASLRSFKTSKCLNGSEFDDEADHSWMSSLTTLNRQRFCEAYLDKIDYPRRLKKASTKSLLRQNRHDLTPPSEVLAKINKWLLKTKEIIESRNQEIANKKRVFS